MLKIIYAGIISSSLVHRIGQDGHDHWQQFGTIYIFIRMRDAAGVSTGLACSEPLWIDRVTKEPSVKAAHAAADLVNVVIYSHALGVSGHG